MKGLAIRARLIDKALHVHVRAPVVHISLVHFLFLHVALFFFSVELVACFWPGFDHVWRTYARRGIALAALLEVFGEYLFVWSSRLKGQRVQIGG